MTMNPREKDFRAKKEGEPDYNKFPKITSSSRQWSSFKNPRIVRVSRSFGGKDRHSKVCTVRGLRDRRIRLSVPTAIQLYDLQDRLGLGQPSKVVDWLLDATKHEIDKLPPLPMIPGNFPQFHQPTLASHESAAISLSDFLTANEAYAKDLGIGQSKEGIKMNEREIVVEKDKWIASQQEQENHQEGFGGFVAQLSAQNLFPLSNQFSVPNFPYNSNYFHWDPPNLSLSQFGGGCSFSTQTEEQSHSNLSPALPSSSQHYLCPSATTLPSINIPPFPSYITPSMENDHLRQINHLQNVQQNSLMPTTLHLISSPMKSFSLSANSKNAQSQENDTEKPDKDNRNS
ncbi:hypothetical protein Pfo_011470 [Paulownia fortunei]|nr:hypothetical protein Pfo_011469 [Paulownia fortunei]KAI3454807.1 hypothetical protein Pfo_011470 [Paulownia fortunei]